MQFFFVFFSFAFVFMQLASNPEPRLRRACPPFTRLLPPRAVGVGDEDLGEFRVRHTAPEAGGPEVLRPGSSRWQPERTNISGKTSLGGRDGKDNI